MAVGSWRESVWRICASRSSLLSGGGGGGARVFCDRVQPKGSSARATTKIHRRLIMSVFLQIPARDDLSRPRHRQNVQGPLDGVTVSNNAIDPSDRYNVKH